VFFLALAVQRIPLGTGYVVWTGIGAVGTSVLGMVLFGESSSAARLAWVGVILVGIVGLKVTSGH
jgi:quaternary ammonium compound-resistance protein SugE